MITTFSNFIYQINEGLIKTLDINRTINIIETEMNLFSCYDFSISGNSINNTISLTLNNFNLMDNFNLKFEHINSLFINRCGWFPSTMKLKNMSDKPNTLSYDESYLVENKKYLKTVEIIYESKFDLETNNIPILYHLSIQSYKDSILNKGLIPKSKSKLTKHLDRIYVCDNIIDCKKLIPKMKLHYMLLEDEERVKGRKPKRNTKWIIFEINNSNLKLKLYNDPNYDNGYYVIENIPNEYIAVVEEE